MAARRHAVLSAKDGKPETRTAAIRGGKGAGLACLTDLGLPVPPSFTLNTGVCRAFMQHNRVPNRVYAQIRREIAKLEQATGRFFGDPDYPLLVSVRSGAEVSMPGMMDTILNVGIDPSNLAGLREWGGKRFARDTRDRFVEQWKTIQHHSSCAEVPSDPYDQLMTAMIAVWESWDSARARSYRAHHNLPRKLGTAVTVQAMVFGNVDNESCTGVVFSADVATGQEGLYGEFLTRAQGEDVVSGIRTPKSIAEMQVWNPRVYSQLSDIVAQLAQHYDDIVDVEFTVQKGELFILQVRKAKRSPLAKVTQAVHDVWKKRCTKEDALKRVTPTDIASLRQPTLQVSEYAQVIARGLAASPGAAIGTIARTSEEAVRLANLGKNAILVREDTSPEDLPGMMAAKAIVTANGGKTCHAAVVARELGLPAIVGAGRLPGRDIDFISVDGTEGVVYEGRLSLIEPTLSKEVTLFLKWLNAKAPVPRIAFEVYEQQFSANQFLIDFYMSDVMARLAVGSSLEHEAAKLRAEIHQRVAETFALYLLLATAGESRHFHEYGPATISNVSAWDAMKRLDQTIPSKNYLLDKGGGLRGMHTDAVRLLGNKAHDFLVNYVGDLVTVFKGHWSSTGFGGANWAKIAEALYGFLTGKLSATLFVDHAFDLRHNGNRLFDKNTLFSRLTDESLIVDQLNAKKWTTNASELFSKLCTYGQQPSQSVLSLWGVGKNKNMW
jgi:pyruvate,orthophosphate dikinase